MEDKLVLTDKTLYKSRRRYSLSTEIPQRLQIPEINFVLLEPKGKRPIQKDWTTKQIKYDDILFKNHLKGSGNYGVIGGGDKHLVIIDFDEERLQEEVIPKLPETFTVRTGRGLLHKYFFSDNATSFKIFNEEGDTLADIQGEGKQVVGAGSLHPNGNIYEVVDDIDIAFLPYSEIKALLVPYNKKDEKVDKKKEDKEKQEDSELLKSIKSKVKMSEVLKEMGIDSSRNPCPCPFHESKGGKCLGFNDEMGTAHCFHCDESWNVFTILMQFKKIKFKEALEFYVDKLNMKAEYEVEKAKYIQNNKSILGDRKIVSLPKEGKLISEFANELVMEIKDKEEVFFRAESRDIVEVNLIDREKDSFLGFVNIKPNRFITLIEKHIEPGIYLFKDGRFEFKRKSISADLANTLLQSNIVQSHLPRIDRIFTFPIPILYEKKLTFPKKGYDARFKSFLNYNSPEINCKNIDLDKAKEVIDYILREFCFQDDNDKANAIAAMITPFLRGLFSSFRVRTPLWIYLANRERAGKDYLADINGLLYEGYSLEEPPICTGEKSNNNEELKKKILSALINGRKRLHFANNKGFLDNSVLEAVITAERYSDRMLGRNDILTFDNELDFSLSGNIGIGFTPDIANRSKFIRLFLDIEDANSRRFDNPGLHKWVAENRGLILSCFFRMIIEWIDKGSPKGKIPFASFYEWSEIVGGIMEVCGYANPCIKDKENLAVGGDTETTDMKRLFEMCNSFYGEEWIDKTKIRNLIKNSDEEIFHYFDFEKKTDQIKFGLKISKFVGRVLSNIRLVSDGNSRVARQLYKFQIERFKQ